MKGNNKFYKFENKFYKKSYEFNFKNKKTPI